MTGSGLPVLILLGQPQPSLEIEELEPSVSTITGKRLQSIKVRVSVRGDDASDRLDEELKGPANAEVLIQDTGGGAWRVGNRMSSSSQGSSLFSHSIELTEHEQVNLAAVEFGQLSLVPESWNIRPGKPMALQLMVTLDGAGHLEPEKAILATAQPDAPAYFLVRMVGVRDEPISMRFGRCLWQPLSDGQVRHVINLIAEEDDDPRGLGFSEPEISRLKEHSLAHDRKLGALLEELQSAGILGEEAIKRIMERANNVPDEAWREFDRSRNVDTFMRD